MAPSKQQGLVNVDLNKLNTNNYDAEFHILAVGNLVSALAIHSRYEKDLENPNMYGEAKLTDLARHDDSYMAIEDIIMNNDGKKMYIYKRGETISSYPIELTPEHNSNSMLLAIWRMECNRSNSKYALSGFLSDYEDIMTKMNKRNADVSQREQLNQVRNKYLEFLGRAIAPEL